MNKLSAAIKSLSFQLQQPLLDGLQNKAAALLDLFNCLAILGTFYT